MPFRALAASAILVAILSSCAASPSASDRPLVLASTTLFADMARNVAGDRLRVESIVPAGATVEDYEARPEDARRVSDARLFLLNGLDLDAWAAPLLRNRRADAAVVTLSDGLPAIGDNPHMWFDLELARRYVDKMRDAFIALDPAGKDAYTAAALGYSSELLALDREIRAQVATIPPERRKIVTSHDAFPYFARAYGLEVVGFAQAEAGRDPTPSELARLVEAIRAAGVPAIFSEVGVSPALARTLASEAGVTRVVTDLPTDSVLAPPADTFVGVVRTVARKITDALR